MNEAIAKLQEKLAQQLDAVRRTKTAINAICEAFDLPLMYTDVDHVPTIGSTIRSDQFYGQPLATCTRAILEMRKSANRGPASVNDIFDALTSGGYSFETKDADNAKRGLRISLRKNAAFHKLPGGQWGLTEWYPNAKKTRDDDEKEDGADADTDQPKAETQPNATTATGAPSGSQP